MKKDNGFFKFTTYGNSCADDFEFKIGSIFKNGDLSKIEDWFVILNKDEILTFSGERFSKSNALDKLKNLNIERSDSPWISQHICVYLPSGKSYKLKELKNSDMHNISS